MAGDRTLKVTILGDSSSVRKAFNDVDSASSGLGGKLSKFGVVAGAALAGAGTAAVAFGASAIKAAGEAAKVTAQTDAVIKSTAGAANVSSKEIETLSHSLQGLSGVEDEAIQSGANMLLTFTNIKNEAGAGNDVFNQATKTLLDMSVATGTDAKSAAIQLGKALNDPIKGISALSRVGVTFTEQQKDQIKAMVAAGDTAGAQKIILAELNKEFGGSAKAAGDAQTPMQRLSMLWSDMQENIGTALIPVIEKFVTIIMRVGSVVGPIFSEVFGHVQAFFNTLRTGFTEDEGTPIERFALKVRDVFQTVSQVVRDVFASIVAFIDQNGPKFVETFEHIINGVRAVFDTLEPIIRPIVEFAMGAIVPIIQNIVNIIKNVALLISNIINGDFGAAFGNLLSMVRGTIDTFIQVWGRLPGLILQVAGAALSAALTVGKNIMEGIGKGLSAAAGFAGDVASAVLRAIKNVINTQVIDRLNSAIPNSLGAGPFKVDLPDNPIPRLHGGGTVTRAGLVNMLPGEEIVALPGGASVIPLSRGVGATIHLHVGTLVGTGGMEEFAELLRTYLLRLGLRNPSIGLS